MNYQELASQQGHNGLKCTPIRQDSVESNLKKKNRKPETCCNAPSMRKLVNTMERISYPYLLVNQQYISVFGTKLTLFESRK